MSLRAVLWRLACVAPTCACLARAAEAQRDTLRYELALATDGGARVLDVRLTLRGDASGTTTLQLPSAWGDQPALYRAVVELTPLTDGLRLERSIHADSLFARRVHHAPGAALELRYRLRQDWQGALERSTYGRVLLGEALALLTGHNALIVPARADSTPCVVTILWRGLPPDWRAESSFGRGPEWHAHTTFGDLRDMLLVAGQLRVQEQQVGAQRVRIALHGAWPFPDSTVTSMVHRLLAAQLAFWRDSVAGQYLVTLVPAAGMVGGAALADGMVALARPDTPLSDIAPLMAHEIFHRWSGRRIRSTADGRHKWLTEGVTDYYADRFARDVGLLSADEYLDRVNQALLGYYASPVRNVPDVLVERRYWRDPGLTQLSYQRGYVLSLRMDALLREETNDAFSLDDYLRGVYAGALANGGAISDTLLVEAAPERVRPQLRALLAPVLEAGETVAITGHELGECHSYRVVTASLAEVGFDPVASSWASRVRHVRPGSAAYEAGLREGMPLVSWGWREHGAERAVEVLVHSDAGPSRISFVPRERSTLRLPQYVARRGCRS